MADKDLPQKIIHMNEDQVICFVGHNFADRTSKIGFLSLDHNEVSLCWIVVSEPFKKRAADYMHHLEI